MSVQAGVTGRVGFGFIARFTGAVLSLLLACSAVAVAQSETASVDIRFWAFSSNPIFFAYQTTNHLDEEMFVVGQVGSPEPAFVQSADEENSPRDILISREVRDLYGWNADGTRGATSPSGYSAVTLTETGVTISVTAVQGGRTTPIGTIERMTDQAATRYATAELKELIWSPHEDVVVVILEQALAGDWPLRVQTAHGFSVPPRPQAPPAPPQ